MKKNSEFKKAVEFVFKWEGGYSNDPNDPGGETKFGISKRSYPELDISKLTLEQAKKIYYENYWLKSGCQNMEYPLNLVVFDTAVNMGRRRAEKIYDEAFGSGWRGYLLLRLYTYSRFKLAKIYFRGWSNRVLDLYKTIEEVK